MNEVSEQAIGEFTLERLRSYYVANRSVAQNALALFKEAESLLPTSPSAALVLFTTAVEVDLKVTLLTPVVYGLVHNESIADLVSDLSVKHSGSDRFKLLLTRLLEQYGSIDFNVFTIEGRSKTIWEEITILQSARNGVVHRAELAQPQLAELSRDVAMILFGMFLPSVLEGLGLKFSKDRVLRFGSGDCRWDLMNEESARFIQPGSMPSTPAIWSACLP